MEFRNVRHLADPRDMMASIGAALAPAPEEKPNGY